MQLITKFAGLDGALVLVTGGATGIGSAIVENFVRQGSGVVFLDIKSDAGGELIARLSPGRGLARTLGPKNIRINCVVPGFVRTKRQLERWLTPELEQVILDGQCLKRFVEPEDVASLVAFLASDDARSCTNQTFAVVRCTMANASRDSVNKTDNLRSSL